VSVAKLKSIVFKPSVNLCSTTRLQLISTSIHSLGGDDLVARLPREAVCHGCDASACAGVQCDFFRLSPNHLRQGGPNSVWHDEKNGVVYVMGNSLASSEACTARRETLGIGAYAAVFKYAASSISNHSFFESGYRLGCGHVRSFAAPSDFITVRLNSRANWAREKVRGKFIRNSRTAHVTTKSRTDCSRLPGGVDEFPYSREMMIVVFGDKIQMVHEPHRRLYTRVGNGSGKQ
jgi:hypothetical protein